MTAPPWQRGLYLLTPDDADTARLVDRVGAVVAEASLVQYRNKSAHPALRQAQAHALLALCRKAGVAMVVNDDVQLAASIGADGVHLGESDGDPRQARLTLGDEAIIGVSCYDSLARAQGVADSVDYLAFGAFFPTASKPNARRADPSLLSRAAPFGLPRVAIGGITPDNARGLVAAGADLVAVISGVFDAPDPVLAARAYRACFD